jgi:ferredoxin-NADP reductase
MRELDRLRAEGHGLEIFQTFTRSQPPGWTGYSRRIDSRMLSEVVGPFGRAPQTFICGPTLLVESVADGLVQLGVASEQIRTERFGPTGGTS